MLWRKIESEGLGQYSYLLGDGGEALVVDPRLDIEEYEASLARSGYRLRYILETHRHEDYVVGSVELGEITGAETWHADRELDYKYNAGIKDGQEWAVGALKVRAVATPGHTRGHMSFVLHDRQGSPWMVFSGDALLAGSVGRTDLLGENEMAELTEHLYDSIFGRLLPLGDEVILCPTHGSGSACGGGPIADRPWTTIGFERRHNPLLSSSREEFVRENAKVHDSPPYFRDIAWRNLLGPRISKGSMRPMPLDPEAFAEKSAGAVVLDVREPESFGGAHVPGSINIYWGGVSTFTGWFFSCERPLLAVLATDDPEQLARALLRIGYGPLEGYLAGGMHAWYSAGLPTAQIECVTAAETRRRAGGGTAAGDRPGGADGGFVLDVRSPEELESDGEIPGALNIPVRHILDHLAEIPQDRTVTIFCGSGRRSMIAASLLRARGWEKLIVVLGGVRGWMGAG